MESESTKTEVQPPVIIRKPHSPPKDAEGKILSGFELYRLKEEIGQQTNLEKYKEEAEKKKVKPFIRRSPRGKTKGQTGPSQVEEGVQTKANPVRDVIPVQSEQQLEVQGGEIVGQEVELQGANEESEPLGEQPEVPQTILGGEGYEIPEERPIGPSGRDPKKIIDRVVRQLNYDPTTRPGVYEKDLFLDESDARRALDSALETQHLSQVFHQEVIDELLARHPTLNEDLPRIQKQVLEMHSLKGHDD